MAEGGPTQLRRSRGSGAVEDQVDPPSVKVVRTSIGDKELRTYRFVKVKSPSEFYVVEDLIKVDQWMREMQKFYNKMDERKSQVWPNLLVENKLYAWCDVDNNQKWWHRVKVLEPQVYLPGPATALVRLIDIDMEMYVNVKDLVTIDPKFAKPPVAGGFVAYLAHIKPFDEVDNWSMATVQCLREMTPFNTVFYGVILEKDNGKTGLILSEKGSNLQPQFTLQWRLVGMNYANSFGFGAGRHDLVGESGGHDKNKMLNFLTPEERKLYSSAVIPDRDKKFSSLYRGPVSTIRSKSVPMSFEMPKFQSDYKEECAKGQFMCHKMLKNVAWIVVSAVAGPSRFYIQMRQQNEELEEMMEDLGKVVAGQMPLDPEKVKAGRIVAARIDEQNVEVWARVVIKSVQDETQEVEVILIDFGLEAMVSSVDLRALPSYFRKVDPYCRRAHLDVVARSKRTEEIVTDWTKPMMKVFGDYVNLWMIHDPHYYAWQPRGQRKESRVNLEQLDQNLHFDEDWSQWYFYDAVDNSPYETINWKKKDPLLRHFFSSVGVDIVYESKMKPEQSFRFDPIWDDLQEKFEFKIDRPPVKTKIH